MEDERKANKNDEGTYKRVSRHPTLVVRRASAQSMHRITQKAEVKVDQREEATKGEQNVRNIGHNQRPPAAHIGRFLRHRSSPKPTSVATPNSLPKRNHIAKEAVSAAWQTKTRHRSERQSKPNDAPKTKPRPCVKTMLADSERPARYPSGFDIKANASITS